MNNLFREKLETGDDFLLTVELVPGRSIRTRGVASAISFAKEAAQDGLIDALSITDNPSGNPSMSPDVLGRELRDIGFEPIVHFTCRDQNRYGMFSRAVQLERLCVRNLLVLTGDYPVENRAGTAKPDFDMDSVAAMQMLSDMNKGIQLLFKKNDKVEAEKTDFLLGAAVSCYKFAESEVLNQYYKLLRKIRSGCKFVITQICYDARKFEELQKFLAANGCEVPVLGSVFVLNAPAARFMNKGNVPGVHVPEGLLKQIESESKAPDKGKAAALLRAAKMMAILKGLGYRGAHIGGAIKYDDVKTIVSHFHRLQEQWADFVPEFDMPYPGGFYLYKKNNETGLNTAVAAEKSRRGYVARAMHAWMKMFHHLMFDKEAGHYPLLKRCIELINKVGILRWGFCLMEKVSKKILFDCQECGDCALEDMAYLCPQSQCAKYMRNGPCGGSDKTMCEVKKEKRCVWVRVYERLRSHGEEGQLDGRCVPPRNWALDKTSSWLNFYLERDYRAFLKKYDETES